MFDALIKKRRSIRKYLPRKLEREKIDALVESGLRAPSSRGLNPWTFCFVTEPALLEKLSRCKPHGAAFLKDAPLGIVVAGDPRICDVWIEDCAIASAYFLLAAQSLGLGACWIQIRERNCTSVQAAEQYVAETLGLESGLKVESIIAVGYPGETKPAYDKTELRFEKVIFYD